MLAESVYKGVLDNGNFLEFLHGAGGWKFSTFKTGIPGGPVSYFALLCHMLRRSLCLQSIEADSFPDYKEKETY